MSTENNTLFSVLPMSSPSVMDPDTMEAQPSDVRHNGINCTNADQSFMGETKPCSLSMFGSSTCNATWPVVFGTSPWFSEASAMTFTVRALLTTICTVHLILIMIDSWAEGQRAHYFQELTSWSLIIQTAYLWLATSCTFIARRHIILAGGIDALASTANQLQTTLPSFIRALWITFHIAMPAALTVTLLYWLVVNPFWALVWTPDYFSYFAHGGNLLILLVDFMLSRMPFYPRHAIWFFLVALTYSAWTLIHFWAKVGSHKTCESYPQNECPTYDIIDWHRVGPTAGVMIVVLFFVVPVVQLPFSLHTRFCKKSLSGQ